MVEEQQAEKANEEKTPQQVIAEFPMKEIKRVSELYTLDGEEGGKLTVEQFYPLENMKNLLLAWESELEKKKGWLAKYEEHKQSAIDEAAKQINNIKAKLEQDVTNIEIAYKMWKETVGKCQDKQK